MNPINAARSTNARKAKVSDRARNIEMAPRTTMTPIVITVGREGRFVWCIFEAVDVSGAGVGSGADG